MFRESTQAVLAGAAVFADPLHGGPLLLKPGCPHAMLCNIGQHHEHDLEVCRAAGETSGLV